MLRPYWQCWLRREVRSLFEYSRQYTQEPDSRRLERCRAVDAGDSPRGIFDEHSRSFPRSAYRVVHDPAAPLDAQEKARGHSVWAKNVPELRADHITTEMALPECGVASFSKALVSRWRNKLAVVLTVSRICSQPIPVPEGIAWFVHEYITKSELPGRIAADHRNERTGSHRLRPDDSAIGKQQT